MKQIDLVISSEIAKNERLPIMVINIVVCFVIVLFIIRKIRFNIWINVFIKFSTNFKVWLKMHPL